MNKNIIEIDGDFFVEDLKPGGFRKIKDYTSKKVCLSPSHNPPSHIVLEPGLYEYVCPSCGHTANVNIPLITC